MQTIEDVWNKFATQDELAETYLILNNMFNEIVDKYKEYVSNE